MTALWESEWDDHVYTPVPPWVVESIEGSTTLRKIGQCSLLKWTKSKEQHDKLVNRISTRRWRICYGFLNWLRWHQREDWRWDL